MQGQDTWARGCRPCQRIMTTEEGLGLCREYSESFHLLRRYSTRQRESQCNVTDLNLPAAQGTGKTTSQVSYTFQQVEYFCVVRIRVQVSNV